MSGGERERDGLRIVIITCYVKRKKTKNGV